MSDPGEFTELLKRARQGDEQALAQLSQRYEKEIRLVARVKLGPALRRYLDSVDLAQSVHFALLQGMRHEKFDVSSPEKLVALAVRMMRWKLARHLRRLYRRQRIQSMMADNGADMSTPDSAADPALLAQMNDEVALLMKELDETERRLVELRLEGCTTSEAARIMGVNADVLRVRLSRLRKRLQEQGKLADWL